MTSSGSESVAVNAEADSAVHTALQARFAVVNTSGGELIPLVDEDAPRRIVEHDTLHRGAIWDLARDRVDLGDGVLVTREYINHTGAVGVVALDDDGRILVIRQYRHPVRHELWEIPAGLLDVPGEDPLLAAQRELAEEADLSAAQWNVLADICTTPGGSSESLRIFLARGVSHIADSTYVREDEERDMPTGWVSLDDAVAAVLAGDVHNPTMCVGTLAAVAARAKGWAALRPADAPWPTRSPGRDVQPAVAG